MDHATKRTTRLAPDAARETATNANNSSIVRAGELKFDLAQADAFLRHLDPLAQQNTFQSFDENEERVNARKKRLAAEIADLRKKLDSEQLAAAIAVAKRKHRDPFAQIVVGSLRKVASTAQSLNKQGAGIYVTANETKLDGQRNANAIVRVRAVFADLDGAPLGPVLSCRLTPHIVVETSPDRFHAFWLVHGLPLDQFEAVQRAIAARFKSDELVIDLPRVVRLPGFYHRKGEPFLSRIERVNGNRLPYAADVILGEFVSNGRTNSSPSAAPTSALAAQSIIEGERNSTLLVAAGRLRGKGLPQSEIETLLLDMNHARCQPPLDESEVLDIARRYEQSDPHSVEWGSAEPIPNTLPAVLPFDPVALLPATLAPWVNDVGDRMQCPLDYLGVAVMVACGSLIGARLGVRPKRVDDWYEVPNLWGLVIGPSGDKKTPALSEMLGGLRLLQEASATQYDQALAAYKLSMVVHEQDVVKKKALHRAGKYVLTALDLQDPARPAQRRYLVHDTTVEALGVILQDNPYGVMCYADELVGLLSRLDGEERRADRAFYLAGYNGKHNFSVDRITRDPVRIPRLCLSILGSTQPDAIKQYLRQAVAGGVGNDGLMQRFQLAVFPDRKTGVPKVVDRAPDLQAIGQAMNTFRKLEALDPVAVGAQRGGGLPTLGFDAQAQPDVMQWLLTMEHVMQQSSAHPALISHYSKYRKTIISLALIIHLADGGTGPISLIAFTKALAWSNYLRSHAKRIYASVNKGHMDAARVLADRIERGKLSDGFTAREVTRSGWTQLASSEQVRDAIEVLVDYGWLHPYEDRDMGGGRPTTRYRINPTKRKAA